MATRNERKKRARIAKAQAKAKGDLIAQSLKVKAIVAHNKLHGIERNFYPESLMASLKERGTYGRVMGERMSTLEMPIARPSGTWWQAVKKSLGTSS